MEACLAVLLCPLEPLMYSASAENSMSVNAEMKVLFQLSVQLVELQVPDVYLAQVSQLQTEKISS